MPEHRDPPPQADAPDDVTRRTWLATERTWLAWVRTGLTSTGVALAVGKVVPAVGDTDLVWPYDVLGVGYALLGVALVAYGFLRRREVEEAVAAGAYRFPGAGPMQAFAVVATLLGLATAVVVLLP